MRRLLRVSLLLLALCSTTACADPYRDGVQAYEMRQLAKATRSLQAAVRQSPNDPRPHLMLSRCLLRQGHPQQAQREVGAALRLTGDNLTHLEVEAWSWHVRSVLHPDQNGPAGRQATRAANLAVALYPQQASAWLLRADLEASPLHAFPFYAAAHRVAPDTPLPTGWRVPPPHIPQVHVPERLPALPARGTAPRRFTASWFEEGMGCLEAYVPEAAEQAFLRAPDAMGCWGLSFCLPARQALPVAERGLKLAKTNRERRYLTARLLELTGRPASLDALDGALAAYPGDANLWWWRGIVNGTAGTTASRTEVLADMPYVLAGVLIAPRHWGLNHELVHAYEDIDRPLLGWPYAVQLRHVAPDMPHLQHMEAHLAMRLGRWEDAVVATVTAVHLSQQGWPDSHYGHHINIALQALAHQGQFREAAALPASPYPDLGKARMYRLEVNPAALEAWAKQRQKQGQADGLYVQALVDLLHGRLAAAQALLPQLQKLPQWTWYGADTRYWWQEIQGRLAAARGQGLQALQTLAERSGNDAHYHAFGAGSYLYEVWGEAALRARRYDEASTAFAGALANDHGSIVGALGLQVVGEVTHNPILREAGATRAAAIWRHADPGALARLMLHVRSMVATTTTTSRRTATATATTAATPADTTPAEAAATAEPTAANHRARHDSATRQHAAP
ncbi:MAG: tetratricopeptide repeat protein [Candidatus Xenobia bacterium]